MNNKPLVSCIIPTFNRSYKLVNAVKSIQNQSYKNLEIIVVDDQSADNTKEVVYSIIQEDNRIQYHLNPKKGANNARNFGISVSKGEFISFLDDDDVWLQDKTSKQIEAFQNLDEKYGVVYCPFIRKSLDGKKQKRHPSKYSKISNGNILKRILKRNFIGTPTILVRSTVFKDVGSFNPKFSSFQDWELLTKIAAKHHFYYLNDALVISYESFDSITRNKHGRIITSIMHLKQFMYLYQSYPSILSKRYKSLAFRLFKLRKYYFAGLLIKKSLKLKPFSLEALLLFSIIKIKNKTI